ncbi:MAG: hypothetical protein M3Z64_06395 [Verrucomicrobiota bacterium]|nr:hypothetical protein [Verrucomicrobiota bacterium]
MYILRRLAFFAFLIGIYLLVAGAYDAFIQASALVKPDTVAIGTLEKEIPWNRHLIVTGGNAVVAQAVEYYTTRRGVRVPNSEVYFIPIGDASKATAPKATPVLIVKMTAAQLQKAKLSGGFDSQSIEGIRMTNWDLESKAEEYLARAFGKPAVGKMVILDYQRQITDVLPGLTQFVSGLLVILGLSGVWFYTSTNRSRQIREFLECERVVLLLIGGE